MLKAQKKRSGAAGLTIRPFSIFCMVACGAAAFAGADDLQARIDACSASGGGVVRVDQGLHADMNPIVLKDNVELRLDAGAVLRAATNYSAYAHMPGCDRGAFISAIGATNIAITGEGRIECSGDRAPFVARVPGRWRGIRAQWSCPAPLRSGM